MSDNSGATAPAAAPTYYSQLYAGVSLKQLNMAVISTLAVLVIIIIFLTLLRARSRFRYRTQIPSTNLQPVGSRGLFMDPIFSGSRGLDPALISTVGRSYAYEGEANDSREKDEAQTKETGRQQGMLLGKECVVCLAEYRIGEELKSLHACGHSFHEECINAWIAGNQSCPVCRTALVAQPEEPPPEVTGAEPCETALPVAEMPATEVPVAEAVAVAQDDHERPESTMVPRPHVREVEIV